MNRPSDQPKFSTKTRTSAALNGYVSARTTIPMATTQISGHVKSLQLLRKSIHLEIFLRNVRQS